MAADGRDRGCCTISDILILGSVASAGAVGTYRLASRLTLPLGLAPNMFFLAWLPLEQTPFMRASYQQRGRQELRGVIITYLVLMVAASILLFVACVHLVEIILPSSYHETIGLLPWLAGAVIARVILHTIHRFGRMANRRIIYDRTLTAAAVLSVPLGYAGFQLGGAAGVAASSAARQPVRRRRALLPVPAGRCQAAAAVVAHGRHRRTCGRLRRSRSSRAGAAGARHPSSTWPRSPPSSRSCSPRS